ncbi:uncharacterized protein LOC115621157 [Scaptodrosophila lebanonensis]|uniref:Uncharacterized protein LOC115621157 n=1 Tax=Drosophila lebanonensis TaxID=7225 RepID=A0A6J2T3L0_DROLE|nr:uncharacterized protein LOC115621157 [Scaptodrosophila lebanonensis]
MDYILEITEEANRQLASEAQQTQDGCNGYISIFRIGGEPILPPLMTPEKRLEMQSFKQQALEIEERLRNERMERNETFAIQVQETTEEPCLVTLLTHVNRSSQQSLPPSQFKATQTCRLSKQREEPGEPLKTPAKHAAPTTPSRVVGGECSKFADASTNTELTPLMIVGRNNNQRLQRSETLIYDNNSNAIIKPVKEVEKPKTETKQLVLEDQTVLLARCAVCHNSPLKFGLLQTTWVHSSPTSKEPCNPNISERRSTSKELRKRPSLKSNPKLDSVIPTPSEQPGGSNCKNSKRNESPKTATECGKRSKSAPAKKQSAAALEVPSDDESLQWDESENKNIFYLMTAPREVQEQAGKERLQRATTSPALKAVDSTTNKNLNRTSSAERNEKLSPLLWRRCRSYPLEMLTQIASLEEKEALHAMSPMSPISPNTSPPPTPPVAPPLPPANPTESYRQRSVASKIEIKQRMAPGHVLAKTKARSATNSNGNTRQPSRVISRGAMTMVTPMSQRPSHSERHSATYGAHGHASHTKMQTPSNNAMNNAKRRLTYDPRASIKRNNMQQKKSNTNNAPNNNSGSHSAVAKASNTTTTSKIMLKRRQPDELHKARSQISYRSSAPTHAMPKKSIGDAAAASSTENLVEFRTNPRLNAHGSRNVELLKRRMMGDMELHQRRRFQQLVTEQMEQHRRMQAEFEAQQQHLIDQLLSDMASYAKCIGKGPDRGLESEERGQHNRIRAPAESVSGTTLSSSSSFPMLLHRAECLDEDSDEREAEAEIEAAVQCGSQDLEHLTRGRRMERRGFTTDSENI